MAKLRQPFFYSGLATEYNQSFPGDLDYDASLPFMWGLGKPTSGQYDISAGGFKNFGGQGQGQDEFGWKREEH
jgi:hypothetical protein